MKEKYKKFIADELKNLKITVEIIAEAINKTEWNNIERAGAGAYLSDMYKGYENIFMSLLEDKGIKIPKGDRWHSDLLERAILEGIAPAELITVLKGMLSYRHRVIHGYSHTIDEKTIRESSTEIIKTHPIFEKYIEGCFMFS